MYLQFCTYVEEYQPEHVYVFTGECIVTGKLHTVRLPAPGLHKYNNGAKVQDAFPDLSAEDREFIISGTSPEGWKQLFGGDECPHCGGDCPSHPDDACDAYKRI